MDASWADYGVMAVVVGLVADAIRRYVFERRKYRADAAVSEADASVAKQVAELRVDAAALANAEAQLDFTTKAFDAERASLHMRLEAQAKEIAELREELSDKDKQLAALREQVSRMQRAHHSGGQAAGPDARRGNP